MKADALAALAAILALPADTSYHFTVEYSPEVSEAHTTSTNFDLEIDDSPSSIMP